VLKSLGAGIPLVQKPAFPEKIKASLGETFLLQKNVVYRNAFLELKMSLVGTAKNVLPFVLVFYCSLHKISVGQALPRKQNFLWHDLSFLSEKS
jgi:hypothetical protein